MITPQVGDWDEIVIERLHNDVVHLVPVDDLVEHELDTACVCGPQVEPAGLLDLILIHWALDGRA